jgi:hypothetical protein
VPHHPYDPYKIAPLVHVKGINKTSSLISDSARLVPLPAGFQILLRSGDPRSRQTFSIAHELGHTFFYEMRDGCPVRVALEVDSLKVEEERRCDEFAENLLMPEEEFCDTFRSLMVQGENAMAKLARDFRVGLWTTILRVKRLGLEAPNWITLVLEHRPNVRTGKNPKWRVNLATYPSSVMFIPRNIGAERLGIEICSAQKISSTQQTLTVHIKKGEKNYYKTKGQVHCSGTQVKATWDGRSFFIMLLTIREVSLPTQARGRKEVYLKEEAR